MKRFLISAGEASGEMHGAELIRGLRSQCADAEFFGVGGDAMRAAGFDVVVDARDVAVVGLAEVVKHLPGIYGQFRRLLRAVDERKPDAAILIDFPDFNFRLARQLHARGIPVFYYVGPQLWAWRKGRIKLVRRYVRKMLVIFPFEEEFYRENGVDAVYVGHPFANMQPPACTRVDFAAKHNLDPAKTWIALLPGSRRKEVGLNFPELQAAAMRLGGEYEYIVPVASTLDQQLVAAQPIAQGGPRETVRFHYVREARAALKHARAAAVASGTATLESALLGTPFVMVYRVAPLTWTIGRHLVNVPHYGIVNLILGRRAVPELVQADFTAERVENELRRLLADGPERRRQLDDFAELREKLRAPHALTASDRAAEEILRSLGAGLE